MNFPRYLAAGLLLSVLIHGAGSAYFAEDPNEVLQAASQGGGVSVIGSLEDLVAGSKVDQVEVEEPIDEVDPVTEPVEVVQAKPVELTKVKPPVEAETPPVTATIMPVVSAAVPVVEGVTSAEAVTAETVEQKALEPETAKPVEVKQAAVKKPIEIAKPVQEKPEPVENIKPQPEKAVEVEEPLKQATKLPRVKPEPPIKEAKLVDEAEPVKKAKPVKKKVKKKTKPAKTAQKRGAEHSSRKGGSEITSRTAKSRVNGRADAKTNDGGTKAKSNYKGKVRSKIRRAQRYPKKAVRKKIEGVVHVSFVISRSGSVSNIRIVKSSGHPVLDKAAADQVRRAAPMPKFPSDIRDSKMRLTSPISFVR